MLDIFHHSMTLMFDGKLYTAPIKEDIQNALDVATGTGKLAQNLEQAGHPPHPIRNQVETKWSLIITFSRTLGN